MVGHGMTSRNVGITTNGPPRAKTAWSTRQGAIPVRTRCPLLTCAPMEEEADANESSSDVRGFVVQDVSH